MKFEFRNPKWFGRFDKLTAGRLTTLSTVEGQIQNSNDSMTKNILPARLSYLTLQVRRVVVQVAQGGAEACPRAIQPNSFEKNRPMVRKIFIPT